jgi:tungstate transport system ATP-binding protein
MTLVMTTHDLGQARRLARRVLLLHKGRLIEDAAAADFFAAPATAEGRAFLAGELLW